MRKTIVLLALALAGCNSMTDIDDKWSVPESIQYAPSLSIDLSKMNHSASGLYWQELRAGDGDSIRIGDNIRINYTGWLPDGTQFDTTIGREPVEFPVGLGFIVKGIDEGVIGMRVGGLRRLVIKPDLAFRNTGKPSVGVPPATTIIVDVERLTTPAH